MNENVINIFNRINYEDNLLNNRRTIKVVGFYKRLKERFLIFAHNNDAQFTYFTWYYGMHRCSFDYRTSFYTTLREYYIDGIPEGTTATTLAQFLQNQGRFEFVFATKMLNLLDESRFPIVDRIIAQTFGFNGSYIEDGETLIQDIQETYDFILVHDEHGIVQRFINDFQCEGIGYYRIFDFIFFSLGNI